MIKLFLSILGLIVFLTGLVFSLGYFGPREFNQGDELPSKDVLILNARSLKGAPYDPLMGMHGNIGADFGFMVCSDVPNIAYGLSGYSLKNAMADDFAKNPSAYNSENGNIPSNPYFHRRARNIYAYFKSVGRLMSTGYNPETGDLAFYKKTAHGDISHVALVSYSKNNEYRLIESAPKTVFVQEVSSELPKNRGWILSGYGKLY